MQRVSVGSLLRGERVFQQRLDGVQLLYLPLLLFPRLAHLLLILNYLNRSSCPTPLST